MPSQGSGTGSRLGALWFKVRSWRVPRLSSRAASGLDGQTPSAGRSEKGLLSVAAREAQKVTRCCIQKPCTTCSKGPYRGGAAGADVRDR
jgi:hypothetical protein